MAKELSKEKFHAKSFENFKVDKLKINTQMHPIPMYSQKK